MSVAAIIASVTENVVTYPLEAWKVRNQLSANLRSPSSARALTTAGLSPSVYGNILRTFTRYAVYDYMNASPSLLAGMVAATSETFVLLPFENLKTRMLARNSHVPARELALHVWRTEGITAFFRGTTALYARQITASMARFSMYTLQSSFWGLSLAALAESVASQPFDVLKTRKQCALPTTSRVTLSSLYAGLLPRVLRKWLGTVVVVTVYNRLNYDNDVVRLF